MSVCVGVCFCGVAAEAGVVMFLCVGVGALDSTYAGRGWGALCWVGRHFREMHS